MSTRPDKLVALCFWTVCKCVHLTVFSQTFYSSHQKGISQTYRLGEIYALRGSDVNRGYTQVPDFHNIVSI